MKNDIGNHRLSQSQTKEDSNHDLGVINMSGGGVSKLF